LGVGVVLKDKKRKGGELEFGRFVDYWVFCGGEYKLWLKCYLYYIYNR